MYILDCPHCGNAHRLRDYPLEGDEVRDWDLGTGLPEDTFPFHCYTHDSEWALVVPEKFWGPGSEKNYFVHRREGQDEG